MKWSNKGHEFDDIGHLLQDKKKVYLYGAGVLGKEMAFVLDKLNQWLGYEIAFVDRDSEKQKTGYLGYPVIAPGELFVMDKKDIFVIICTMENNIKYVLKGLEFFGFQNNKDVFTHQYFLFSYLSIHFIYNYNLVFFTSQNIIPSTICNLNCKNCLNFTPYIKENVVDDIEALKNDVDTFFNAIDLIYRFQISGGEPFLYPFVEELITYIGEHYSEQILRFEIVTNGTVFPSESLCLLLNKYNMYVYLDDYRKAVPKIKESYDRVTERFKQYYVTYYENCAGLWFDINPEGTDNSQLSAKEMQNHFQCCENPYSTLRKQKISACNYANYAAKAGLKQDTDTDYFDLAKKYEKKELVEFRLGYNERGYTEFCLECAGYMGFNTNYVKPAIQAPHNEEPK